jgi:hypothetical protein
MNATQTAPARQRKPRTKPERFVSLPVRPSGQMAGVVRITVGKEQADYFLTELAADFGRGFKVEKIGGTEEESYHVNLNGPETTCTCKGHLRWQKCKHSDGLAALVAAGRL